MLTKRARGSGNGPKKRVKSAAQGTASQPAEFDASPKLFQRLLPRQSLGVTVSQDDEMPIFESQLRESQPEAAIVAPIEDSEVATVDTIEAAYEIFDQYMADNFDGIDWARLPRFMKPESTLKGRKSWIYLHGYRVALIKDPSRTFFVCQYCHKRRSHTGGL
jgi:hypothetical protein